MLAIAKLKSKITERRTTNTPQTSSSLNSPNSHSNSYYANGPKNNTNLQAISEVIPYDAEPTKHNKAKSITRQSEKPNSAHTNNTFITGFDNSMSTKLSPKMLSRVKTRSKPSLTSELMKKLIPIDSEILELYSEYTKNYQTIGELSKVSINYSKVTLKDSIVDLHSPSYREINSPVQSSEQSIFNDHITLYEGQQQIMQNHSDQANKVKIQRFKFYYFRINIKERNSPIQVVFNCPIYVTGTNYKIFMSTKAEFPNKFNAEYIIQSKFAKIHAKDNYSYFTDQYLYISLYSETDFELNVQIFFGVPSFKPTSKPLSIEPSIYIPNRAVSQRQFKNDKILENLDVNKYSSGQKLKFLLGVSEERLKKQFEVHQNKNNIQEEKQIDKVAKLLAKDSIINFRAFERKVRSQKSHFQQLAANWLKSMMLCFLCQEIQSQIAATKKHHSVMAKGRLIAWSLKTKTMIQVKENGNTPKERTVFKAELCVYTFSMIIRKKTKKKAKQVITKFMSKICLFLTIMNRQQNTVKKVIHIQRKFRYLKFKKAQYREKIWRMVKENIHEIVQDLRIQKAISPGYDKKKQQHISIDFHVMQQLIDNYTAHIKKKWLAHVTKSIHEKEQSKQIMQDITLTLIEPKLFELPNEKDLETLIEQYAIQKKLL